MTVDMQQVEALAAELAALLDLGEITDRDSLVLALQTRRAENLAALLARDPQGVPTASMVRVRTSRWEEIEKCEAALDRLHAAYEIPTGEEPADD